eukprot:scaffold69131_cov36-Cyclotella_meneghiniana.AAC.3
MKHRTYRAADNTFYGCIRDAYGELSMLRVQYNYITLAADSQDGQFLFFQAHHSNIPTFASSSNVAIAIALGP